MKNQYAYIRCFSIYILSNNKKLENSKDFKVWHDLWQEPLTLYKLSKNWWVLIDQMVDGHNFNKMKITYKDVIMKKRKHYNHMSYILVATDFEVILS